MYFPSFWGLVFWMIVIGKQEDDVENERRESVREKGEGRKHSNTATSYSDWGNEWKSCNIAKADEVNVRKIIKGASLY